MLTVSEASEARQPPGPEPGWRETHRVDAWAEGELGVSWAVTAHPARQRASFQAVVLRPGARPAVLVEDDIELPPVSWELRTSGLWADHVCETPLDHWSYGLEAFALLIDGPAELLGRAVGERVALGWELEFEAAARPVAVEGPAAYVQVGVVHGLLLEGRRRTEVELAAERRHWWGAAPPAVFGVDPAPGAVALPEPSGCWWVALGDEAVQVAHQQR